MRLRRPGSVRSRRLKFSLPRVRHLIVPDESERAPDSLGCPDEWSVFRPRRQLPVSSSVVPTAVFRVQRSRAGEQPVGDSSTGDRLRNINGCRRHASDYAFYVCHSRARLGGGGDGKMEVRGAGSAQRREAVRRHRGEQCELSSRRTNAPTAVSGGREPHRCRADAPPGNIVYEPQPEMAGRSRRWGGASEAEGQQELVTVTRPTRRAFEALAV